MKLIIIQNCNSYKFINLMSKNSTETVKVMVRVRPMNKKELGQGCKSIVTVDKDINQIELNKPDEDGQPGRAFTFDSVYDCDS
jgi:hypothetical protein